MTIYTGRLELNSWTALFCISSEYSGCFLGDKTG